MLLGIRRQEKKTVSQFWGIIVFVKDYVSNISFILYILSLYCSKLDIIKLALASWLTLYVDR